MILAQVGLLAGVSVLVIGGLVSWVARKLVRHTGLSGLDRILGAAFGLLRAAVLVGLAVIVLQFAELDQESWWQEARLRPYAERAAAVEFNSANQPTVALAALNRSLESDRATAFAEEATRHRRVTPWTPSDRAARRDDPDRRTARNRARRPRPCRSARPSHSHAIWWWRSSRWRRGAAATVR